MGLALGITAIVLVVIALMVYFYAKRSQLLKNKATLSLPSVSIRGFFNFGSQPFKNLPNEDREGLVKYESDVINAD